MLSIALLTRPAAAVSPNLVISQVYGAGGNSLIAHYDRDFVEIFNRGSSAVNLNGYSIQYASSTGTGNFGASNSQRASLPSFSLQPGQYYLVAGSTGNFTSTNQLTNIDLSSTLALNTSNGKVALVEGTTSLGCNGGSTPCDAAAQARIVDLVGYGSADYFEGSAAASAIGNQTAARRENNGCTDTDNNSGDFRAVAPNPRYSGSPVSPCGPIVTETPITPTATPTLEPGVCPAAPAGADLATISALQGSGTTNTANNQTRTVRGVVSADLQGADSMNGFYIQDPVGDGDDTTSEGLFIYVPGANTTWFGFDVEVGEAVQVSGRITEFQNLTQMDNVTAITKCGTDTTITPIALSLPEVTNGDLERYEGMLVQIDQTLTVSQNYFLGRYGHLLDRHRHRLPRHNPWT